MDILLNLLKKYGLNSLKQRIRFNDKWCYKQFYFIIVTVQYLLSKTKYKIIMYDESAKSKTQNKI